MNKLIKIKETDAVYTYRYANNEYGSVSVTICAKLSEFTAKAVTRDFQRDISRHPGLNRQKLGSAIIEVAKALTVTEITHGDLTKKVTAMTKDFAYLDYLRKALGLFVLYADASFDNLSCFAKITLFMGVEPEKVPRK